MDNDNNMGEEYVYYSNLLLLNLTLTTLFYNNFITKKTTV